MNEISLVRSKIRFYANDMGQRDHVNLMNSVRFFSSLPRNGAMHPYSVSQWAIQLAIAANSHRCSIRCKCYARSHSMMHNGLWFFVVFSALMAVFFDVS